MKKFKLGKEAILDIVHLDFSDEYMIHLKWDGTEDDSLRGYWNKKNRTFSVFSLGSIFNSLEEANNEIKEIKEI